MNNSIKKAKYFLLKCKNCGNDMKYMTYQPITTIDKKSKKCVYCGKNISIKNSILKEIER